MTAASGPVPLHRAVAAILHHLKFGVRIPGEKGLPHHSIERGSNSPTITLMDAFRPFASAEKLMGP